MKNVIKFLILVVILNLVRYFVAGPIESITIMGPMHQPMIEFPACYNQQFATVDWVGSFFYNFMFWLCATWVFYIMHPRVSGIFIVKSLKIYGLMCLFFISVTAVYMNHFVDGIRVFFQYAMIDAIITFAIVGLANGFLFPLFFKEQSIQSGS